jgi:hypothetical protein
VAEVKKLLPHLLGVPYEQCLKTLIDNKETIMFLLDNIPLLKKQCRQLEEPAIEALLAFKDRLRIPDHDWRVVVDTFNLSESSSIHHVRKLRAETNAELNVCRTIGGRGCEYDINKLLELILKTSPPKDASKPIRIKFAFDGANVTSGNRKQQEIGTLEVLGAEDKMELREELARAIPVINDLNTSTMLSCL